MTTPNNIPGAAVMTDTLDFVKNLWGSMGVPGMNIPGITAPTLSVDELDKKISDLKAVDAWLSVNMSMLRGTIQALEIQRGTIATLKSMGASLAAAIKQPDASATSLFESIPYASVFFHQAPAEAAAPGAAPASTPAEAEVKAPPATAASNPASQMTNPAAWWNLLQDQFKQAVTAAMSNDALAGAASDTASKAAGEAPTTGASAKSPDKKEAPAKAATAKPKTSKINKA